MRGGRMYDWSAVALRHEKKNGDIFCQDWVLA